MKQGMTVRERVRELFTGEYAGVVVKGCDGMPVGHRDDMWAPCNSAHHWQPVNLSITHD